MQHQGYSTQTTSGIMDIDTQFGRAGKYINHPMNLPRITHADGR